MDENEIPVYNEAYGVFPQRLAQKKRSSMLQEKSEKISQSSKRLFFVVLGWALILSQILYRESGADIQKFDPFEILGVPVSANDLEIKKAYKKLSLVYHPDRWVTKDKSEKALAETKFIMVAKAYEALTDPIAKENFQKYGNPDGRQALEMSIGLPNWLLESENQTWVIASYLLLTIVIFPAGVVILTQNAAKAGGNDIKKLYPDSEELFRVTIRAGMFNFMTALDIFPLCAEFRQLVFRNEEEKNFIVNLRNQMARDDKFPLKPPKEIIELLQNYPTLKTEGYEKAKVLLLVHLYRFHDKLNENLMDDLEYMLVRSPIICRSMILHARVTCHRPTLEVAILFQQHLNQAMMPGPYMLLQLPYIDKTENDEFTERIANKFNVFDKSRMIPKAPLIPACVEYLKSDNGGKLFFDDKLKEDEARSVLKLFPVRQVSCQIGTVKEEKSKSNNKTPRDTEYEFEADMFQGDLIHVLSTLTSSNPLLPPGKKRDQPCYAHTPFLPHKVKEEWYVILSGGPNPKGFNNIPPGLDKIISFATLEDDHQPTLVADLTFLTSMNQNDWMGSADFTVGTTKLLLMAYPSCYVDLVQAAQLDMKLLDATKLPKFKHHEEDIRLDKEPTSIYEMMQSQPTDEIDSDFEDEKTEDD